MTSTGNHNQGGHVYATAKIPLPEPEPVGAEPIVPLRNSLDLHRWCVARQADGVTKRRWLALAALLATGLIALVLAGCGETRGSDQSPGQVTAGETLVSIGLWFTWAGSFALGIGILGRVAAIVMPAIAGFAEFLGDIAVVGLASVLLGCSFIWLGNHTWLLALVIGLLLIGLGVRYRVRIARYLGFPRKATSPKAAQLMNDGAICHDSDRANVHKQTQTANEKV